MNLRASPDVRRTAAGRVGHRARQVVWLAIAGAVAGCASPRLGTIETQEAFDSAATYSRTYAALEADACEAARRALLSQGYVLSVAAPDRVRGRKNFQPASENHVEVEINVVCAKEGQAGRRTIAFVNAVQESFALRKSNSSASIGVVPFGSLSLPFLGSEEALIKIGSATITSALYYQRFFTLVERYLEGDAGQRVEAPKEPLDPT